MSEAFQDNKMGFDKLQLIDYIRTLKGKNFSISNIAAATGMETGSITELLFQAYNDFDAHFELMSALDEYNAHLSDISVLIFEINSKYKAKEDENGKELEKLSMTTEDAKMLSSLMDKRSQLHDKKVKFIEKLNAQPNAKQHSMSAFVKKSNTLNQVVKDTKVENIEEIIPKEKLPTKTLSPKFKCNNHRDEIYKILNAFKFQQVNKKNIDKRMKSAKFRKNICSVVKCELITFKKAVSCINKNKIPKPELSVELELYKYWVGKDYEI